MDVAVLARREDEWKKVMTRRIPDREVYRENWELVREFLHSGKGNNP
jgi:hypothetical protein